MCLKILNRDFFNETSSESVRNHITLQLAKIGWLRLGGGGLIVPFGILTRAVFNVLQFTDAPPSDGGASVNGSILLKRSRVRIQKGIRA